MRIEDVRTDEQVLDDPGCDHEQLCEYSQHDTRGAGTAEYLITVNHDCCGRPDMQLPVSGPCARGVQHDGLRGAAMVCTFCGARRRFRDAWVRAVRIVR